MNSTASRVISLIWLPSFESRQRKRTWPFSRLSNRPLEMVTRWV